MGITLEQCKSECSSATSFVCNSMDFAEGTGECHLQTETKHTKPSYFSAPCYLSRFSYLEKIGNLDETKVSCGVFNGVEINVGDTWYPDNEELALTMLSRSERATYADGRVDACNMCNCLENGIVTCLKAPCANASCWFGDLVTGEERHVGDTWADDCNTCNCQEYGIVSCTEMFCGNIPRPIPEFASGDISYCFATCKSGIFNSAPGGDSDGDISLGAFACNEEEGGLYAENFVPNGQWIKLPQSVKTGSLPVGPKTFAILLKHGHGYVKGQRVPREIKQRDSFALNSEPWPAVRAGVTGCSHTENFPDVYSKTEFVLVVVTVDGKEIILYRNGVKLGSKACSKFPPANDNPFELGENHLSGTIKSFALWNRALSAEEVASIDSTKLTCGPTVAAGHDEFCGPEKCDLKCKGGENCVEDESIQCVQAPCCPRWSCTASVSNLCLGKNCGAVCDTSNGLLTVMKSDMRSDSHEIMRYCQPDGSCGMNSKPDCKETLKQEGESCGSCLCPPTYTAGTCEEGLECVKNPLIADAPGVCTITELDCTQCKSIEKGQKCGQDEGPFRMTCTHCCQASSTSSSSCAEWRCDAGGWLCQKQCPIEILKQEGESCGSCPLCPRIFTAGTCESGLTCVHDPLIADAPGTCTHLCKDKACGAECDTTDGMLQVMRYCQPDGSCGSNSLPECKDDCYVLGRRALCSVDYPSDWTGPKEIPTVDKCPPSCPYCSSGGTRPPPNSMVKSYCFQFPPP